MNALKNLLILLVLLAAIYGVYVALVSNTLPKEVTDNWSQPAGPTVEMPETAMNSPPPVGTSTPPGSLAIGTGVGPESSASPAATAPPYSSSPAAPGLTTVKPYASSDPTVSLGPPTTPESNEVRNLSPPPADSVASEEDRLLEEKFAAFMEEVNRSLASGKLAEVHLTLSMFYTRTDMPEEQGRQIISLLDQLAGTVVYSKEHYLEPAYHARGGETIEQIAQRYEVPWQLLARINGLMPPDASNDDRTKDQPLPDGMELKVLRGPFDALVNLERRELTLMLQGRYAGRFSIGVGRDWPNIEGMYSVQDKILNPGYKGPDGVNIAPEDPRNPLGEAWIGLSNQVGIHGVADPRDVSRDDNRGSICATPRDIQDLYGILSVGSKVKVMR